MTTKVEAYHQLESVVKYIESSSSLVDINFATLYQSDIRNYFVKM